MATNIGNSKDEEVDDIASVSAYWLSRMQNIYDTADERIQIYLITEIPTATTTFEVGIIQEKAIIYL